MVWVVIDGVSYVVFQIWYLDEVICVIFQCLDFVKCCVVQDVRIVVGVGLFNILIFQIDQILGGNVGCVVQSNCIGVFVFVGQDVFDFIFCQIVVNKFEVFQCFKLFQCFLLYVVFYVELVVFVYLVGQFEYCVYFFCGIGDGVSVIVFGFSFSILFMVVVGFYMIMVMRKCNVCVINVVYVSDGVNW